MVRKILIVGATGQQGSATIEELLALPTSSEIHIVGLTRTPNSPKAKALAAAHLGRISFVQGDLNNAPAVFGHPTLPPGSLASLYLLTLPGRAPEDAVGKAWIDAALAHGVEQIVLSTVDRGGDPRSWDAPPTSVPHFAQKHAVEMHLAASSARHRTVLRPVALLDNMNAGVFCGLFTAMWATVGTARARPLQFVSARDVGRFAARALADPEGWDRRALAIAGDEMAPEEARAVFRRVVGRELPRAWWVFGRIVFWLVPGMREMFAWFGTDGFRVDIKELRRMEPRLQDFETWLKEESRWESKSE